MSDRRRILGTFAIGAVVLLRLAIGWHFYRQGTEKFAYDADEGRYRADFSAEGFLAQAKGPLAGWFHAQVPDVHGWSTWLAVARQNRLPTAEEAARQEQWLADDERARAEAEKNNQPAPLEFPPFAPYFDWARQVNEDWSDQLIQLKAVPGLSDEQGDAADQILRTRTQQLANYLASEAEAIAEYQHELSRLKDWQAEPEADGVPFQESRIATKAAETTQSPSRWVSQVRELDHRFHEDLSGLLSDEQRGDAAIGDPRSRRLELISAGVAIMIVTVGLCLLLGFFTRLASLAGALFLLAVIASQPPWVPGAAATIEQTVELAGLFVLAGTGAGRWFGLDFFTYALFNKCCRRSEN